MSVQRETPAGGGCCDDPALPSVHAATPHSLETNPQTLSPTSELQSLVHGHHNGHRDRVLRALDAAPDSAWASACRRIRDCCSVPHAGVTSAGAVGVVWFRCRHRMCPRCGSARASQVERKIAGVIKHADDLRFLTLTLKSAPGELKPQLDRLYAALKEMRRSVDWKRHVNGGVFTAEVTWNPETREWHPHLHLLIDGHYWHQSRIKKLWHDVTGDSTIVHIEPVYSRGKAASYLAGYVSKPEGMDDWPPHVIRDYANGVFRRRMVSTFGSLHGVEVDGDTEEARDRVSDDRVPLCQIEARSRMGCRRSQIVLVALAQQSQLYVRTLQKRSIANRPVLASRTAETLAAAPAAMADLHRLWVDDGPRFVYGGDHNDWDRPAKPPPRPKRSDDGQGKLGDWHRKHAPHW